jgi:hypothetical protein
VRKWGRVVRSCHGWFIWLSFGMARSFFISTPLPKSIYYANQCRSQLSARSTFRLVSMQRVCQRTAKRALTHSAYTISNQCRSEATKITQTSRDPPLLDCGLQSCLQYHRCACKLPMWRLLARTAVSSSTPRLLAFVATGAWLEACLWIVKASSCSGDIMGIYEQCQCCKERSMDVSSSDQAYIAVQCRFQTSDSSRS